jgi:hypothetical protein
MVREGLVERDWESDDGLSETAEMVLLRNKGQGILRKHHVGSSEGYLSDNKSLNKIRQRYHWLHVKGDIKSWSQQCDTCAERRGP